MNFTNKDILQIAMKQSAIDANCSVDDFCKSENVIVESVSNENARKYLKLPLDCNLISYGNNIVAAINKNYRNIVETYINKFSMAHCFETPNMHVLDDAFREHGMRVCFMAEYFLPDITCLKEVDCDSMWQIGVDVLPEYRRKGIASAITSRLAIEILKKGKVPFYCAAWSNIRSVRNAIKCGFKPAWVEMTVKDIKTVEEMNG